MHLRPLPVVVLSLLIVTLTFNSSSAAAPEQVQQAIKKAQDFLLSQQNADGTWEQVPKPVAGGPEVQQKVTGRQWGGLTSIATYALLSSGINPQDARLKKPIAFLLRANIQGTYALGLSCQVWPLLPSSPQLKAVMYHDLRLLTLGLRHKGATSGFYGYWTGLQKGSDLPRFSDNDTGFVPQPGDWYDLSNSQYGVLGMWALEQAGAEVPVEYWKTVEAGWKRLQFPEGSWPYREGEDGKASMTAAGVATLFITQDYTLGERWGVCKGNAPSKNIEAGLDWMDKHAGEVLHSGDFYTIYGIQRIGVASGRKYFGTLDWFKEGADAVVGGQAPDGSWTYSDNKIVGTGFALLFLSRGSAPVMLNKLEYTTPHAPKEWAGAWDERPRDAANLARWTGRQLERDLNWQIVNLKVPPEELHDAPILYISGSQPLGFKPDEVVKLRTFVEQGGLIVANADCAQAPFADSVKKLGKQLFPKYEFRPLPPGHVIYTREQFPASRWRTIPQVLALSNGVRELILLVPDADASRAWQTRADRTHQDLYELGADVFLYSADRKNLLAKGATYIVTRNPDVQATKKLKVARVMAGPNPDPEPGGWRRLSAILHNRHKIDLDLNPVTPGDGSLLNARIAHLTGTAAFALKPEAREEIKLFISTGGTLIVDAAGGAPEFADAAEAELKAIFGPAAKSLDTPLPADSPVYNLPDAKVPTVAYRAYARASLAGGAKAPRLRAIPAGKRLAVFYSREDLSAGLVGEPVDGIHGYEPSSATDLMTAMVLYAAGK